MCRCGGTGCVRRENPNPFPILDPGPRTRFKICLLGDSGFVLLFFCFFGLGSERKIKKLQELEKQLYSDSIFTMSLMKKRKLQLVLNFTQKKFN